MTVHMLTTSDNPYNPFVDFKAWYTWDVQAGYNTSAYLGRVVRTSDALSEADQDLAIEIAMNDILLEDVTGMYKKVSRDDFPDQGTDSA